jgi:hypothetical protein
MIRECGAKARTNGHRPCRRLAMENGRCHLHGGKVPKHNPGPKTEEGKLRQKMGSWKHVMRSKQAIAERQAFRKMMQNYKSILSNI